MSEALQFASSWPGTLHSWLHRPEHVHRRWFGKMPVRVAWLGLLLAVLSPPHGTGVTLCLFRACTGIPCPGCGMTRSMSCGLRGMFLESWHYHPLGLIILALFIATALLSLLPGLWQQRLARAMESRAFLFNILYLGFLFVFIAFGVTRAFLHLLHLYQGCWNVF